MGDQLSRVDPKEEAASRSEIVYQVKNEQAYRSCNKPVNVSNVEDLAVQACHLGIASLKFNLDGGVPQIGSHGEVRNGCDERDGSGDVVEDAVLPRNSDAQSHEGEGRYCHDSSDGPIPVTAMCCEVDVRRVRVMEHIGVDAQRIVGSLGDARHLGGRRMECRIDRIRRLRKCSDSADPKGLGMEERILLLMEEGVG